MIIIGSRYTDPEKATMKAQLLEKLTKSGATKASEDNICVIDPEAEMSGNEDFATFFEETENEILQALEKEPAREKRREDMSENHINRNLDGIYFRVKRDERWTDACLSDLTDDEAKEALADFDRDALIRTILVLKNTLYQLGEDLDLDF